MVQPGLEGGGRKGESINSGSIWGRILRNRRQIWCGGWGREAGVGMALRSLAGRMGGQPKGKSGLPVLSLEGRVRQDNKNKNE